MPVLKRYLSRLYFIVLLVSLYLLFGCSGTNTIVREVPIYLDKPALRDSIVLRDSIIYKDSIAVDSLWFGEVQDSLGQVIGDLKVYFKTKIAELKLNEKHDTVFVQIPNVPADIGNSLVSMANNMLTWWEKSIIYGALGIIISFLIYLRVKRGKLL